MTQLHLSERLATLGIVVALLGLPAPGLAQPNDDDDTDSTSEDDDEIGGISIDIVTIGGDTQDNLGKIWINKEQCDGEAEVEFRLDNVPDQMSTLLIFRGSKCNEAEARDGDGEADCQELDDDGIEITQATDFRVKLRADVLAGNCDATSASREQIWFLAVETASDSSNITEDNYGAKKLDIDVDAPEAPTNIKGGSGENEITVSWRVGRETVDSFEVLIDSTGTDGPVLRDAAVEPEPEPEPTDTDGGSVSVLDASTDQAEPGDTNSECGTGALREGASSEDYASFPRKDVPSKTATSTDLSGGSIIGDSAAVAVIAIDAAGNRSTLSAVECVFVVPTTGFKDQYELDNGEIPQGCPCAATGPVQVEHAWPIAVALGIVAYRRRRRS